MKVDVLGSETEIDLSSALSVVPDWDDFVYAGRTIHMTIDEPSDAIPCAVIVESVLACATGWLAGSASSESYTRLSVSGDGWRVVLDPLLTLDLLELLLYRGLYHLMEFGAAGATDWIVLTDPHEVLAR